MVFALSRLSFDEAADSGFLPAREGDLNDLTARCIEADLRDAADEDDEEPESEPELESESEPDWESDMEESVELSMARLARACPCACRGLRGDSPSELMSDSTSESNCVRASVAVVASDSSPSSMAVRLATSLDALLVVAEEFARSVMASSSWSSLSAPLDAPFTARFRLTGDFVAEMSDKRRSPARAGDGEAVVDRDREEEGEVAS
jgi:hypothetical protein